MEKPNACWYCGILVPYSQPSACLKHFEEVKRERNAMLNQYFAGAFTFIDTVVDNIHLAFMKGRTKQIPPRTCDICPRKHSAKGYCIFHYSRYHKGLPLYKSNGSVILPND